MDKNGFPDNEDKEFLIKAVKNGTPYEDRPEGKWLISSSEFLNWECSLCHEPNAFEDNFCPNCGAKMRKG